MFEAWPNNRRLVAGMLVLLAAGTGLSLVARGLDGIAPPAAPAPSQPAAPAADCNEDSDEATVLRCAQLTVRVNALRRSAVIARLSAGWSPDQLRARAALERAADIYAVAHSGAVYAGETHRAAKSLGAQEEIRAEFAADLATFAEGRIPTYTPVEIRHAARELDALVVDGQRECECSEHMPGPIEHAREDAAWNAYRAAFLTLGRARSPEISEDRLTTWLTRTRLDAVRTWQWIPFNSSP